MMKCFVTFLLTFFVAQSFGQQLKTKNVMIISMDGYRWRELFHGADSTLLFGKKFNTRDSAHRVQKYWSSDQETRREKLMPFVWKTIAKQGQIYGNRDYGNKVNVRNTYWFSYPGRSEVQTGYFDPKINSNEYPDNPNENVLEFINKQKGYRGQVVTFAAWDAVARILNRDRNGMLVNIYGEDVKGDNLTPLQQEANAVQHFVPDFFGEGERQDGINYLLAKAYIRASHPRVVYIDYEDTDDFAHDGKYDFYLDAAHQIDAMIGNLWNYLQQDPFYKGQTSILICPDHGRGDGDHWTSHGSETPHSGETYLMVMGPDTPALGEVKTNEQIYQDQYAQTIANLLGFHFTANHPVGKPVSSVLK